MDFLVLNDNPSESTRIIHTLQEAFPHATVSEIAGRRDFEKALAVKIPSVVITDSRVSWAEGLSILQIVKATSPAIPVIMLTGSGNETLAVAGMKAGLSDYLLTDQLLQLPSAIRTALQQTQQQQQAEEELQQLRQNDSRHRMLAELISDYSFFLKFAENAPDKVEWATNAFSDKVGYTVEELARHGGWPTIIHPEDLPDMLTAREQVLTGQPAEVEYRVQARNGETYWFHTRAHPVRDEQTHCIIGACGITRDITKKKLVEERLHETETRFNTLAEIVPAIFYIAEAKADGRILYVNQRIEEILGFSASDWSNDATLWMRLIHPEDQERVLQLFDQSQKHRTPFIGEYRMIARNGNTVWVRDQAEVICDDSGQPLFLMGIALDITERKQVEEKYKESEIRFDALVEQLPAIVYMFDPNESQRFLYLSPHVQTMSGHPHQQWMEDRSIWIRSIHPEDWPIVQATFRHSLTSCEPFVCFYRLLTPDGRTVWLRDHARTIFDEEGNPQMILGVALNITEQRQIEADRQRLLDEVTEARDRLKTLSRQLITTQEQERQHIARELHDQIGQALTVLKLNLQTCYKKDLGPDLKETVDENIRLIETTIEQVRHLSLELRPSLLDDLGLVSALRWYLDRLAGRAGIAVHFTAQNSGNRLPAEIETTCFRVVQESLTNIIRHAQAQNVFVELREENHELHLHIRDDGTGFDLTASAGTAANNPPLGLLSMQERVQLTGGEFKIESAPTRGTEIYARFQLLPDSE